MSIQEVVSSFGLVHNGGSRIANTTDILYLHENCNVSMVPSCSGRQYSQCTTQCATCTEDHVITSGGDSLSLGKSKLAQELERRRRRRMPSNTVANSTLIRMRCIGGRMASSLWKCETGHGNGHAHLYPLTRFATRLKTECFIICMSS